MRCHPYVLRALIFKVYKILNFLVFTRCVSLAPGLECRNLNRIIKTPPVKKSLASTVSWNGTPDKTQDSARCWGFWTPRPFPEKNRMLPTRPFGRFCCVSLPSPKLNHKEANMSIIYPIILLILNPAGKFSFAFPQLPRQGRQRKHFSFPASGVQTLHPTNLPKGEASRTNTKSSSDA